MHFFLHKLVELKVLDILRKEKFLAGKQSLTCMLGNVEEGKMEKQGLFPNFERHMSFVIAGQN